MADVYNFEPLPITALAFNKDRTEVALCQKKPYADLYKKSGGQWKLSTTLTQHDLNILSIDWAPKANRIVTCSEDRNAYVWNLVKGDWVPCMVSLGCNRAATCAKWSPNEEKLAVATGSKRVVICYYAENNDWWVGKRIHKPLVSTVTSVSWHPNNIVIACGSADYSARVFACPIKDIGEKAVTKCEWGDKMTFGTLLASSTNTGGWVHSVAFSPDGSKLAWVSHNSTVSIMEPGDTPVVTQVKFNLLPFLDCLWLSNTEIVAAGHDMFPVLLTYDNHKLQVKGKLEVPAKKTATKISAHRMFQNLDLRGDAANQGPEAGRTHSQAISLLYGPMGPGKFATAGLDGILAVWDLKKVEVISNLV